MREQGGRSSGAVQNGSPNLRALRSVIHRWMTEVGAGLKGADRLPEYLASQGVLVVSSLTDDELVACDAESELREAPMERAEIAASVRERLERYARGKEEHS
jgi:hypothetical protein